MAHSQIISRDIMCDVVDQLCEEGNFKELVQCDQLKVGNAFCTEFRRWWAVWQGTVCAILDRDLALPVGVRKPVLEWEVVTIW